MRAQRRVPGHAESQGHRPGQGQVCSPAHALTLPQTLPSPPAFPTRSGASQALLDRKVIAPGKTKFAGLSGGGYSAAGMALGLSGTEMRDVW